MVLITDETGEFAGTVAPAWAKDATGEPVATRYEVHGNTLTQVVEHDAATQYPVVADPWLGITLFKSFKRDTYHGDYRYSAWVTGPGAIVLSGGGGVGGLRGRPGCVPRFRVGRVEEEVARNHEQGHPAAAVQLPRRCKRLRLPFTQDYNLERYRANRANWVSGVASHRCNW